MIWSMRLVWLCAHLDRRIVGMTKNSEGKQIPIFLSLFMYWKLNSTV